MESIFDLETGAVLGAEAAGRKPRYPDGEQGSFPLK